MTWRNIHLREIAIPHRQIVAPDTPTALALPYLGLEHIEAGTGRILSHPRISSEGKSTTFSFDARHVLYGKLRPYLNKVAVPEIPGRCSTEIVPILPVDVDRDFLAFLLRTNRVVDAAMTNKTGSRMPRADMEALLKLKVRIPTSLKRQNNIARSLQVQILEVETAKKNARAQWMLLRSIRQAALDSCFDSLADWRPIGSVAKVQSGYAFESRTFKRAGVRLLRNANVLPGRVHWDDTVYLSAEDAERFPSYSLFDGDVLISLDRPVISSGVKVARVGVFDLPALLLQRVGRFLVDASRLDPAYLFAFLQSSRFVSMISHHDQSLGVPHISPSQIEAIEMPLPCRSQQRQIASRLGDIFGAWETASAALRRQFEEFESLPQRLLAQAFEF